MEKHNFKKQCTCTSKEPMSIGPHFFPASASHLSLKRQLHFSKPSALEKHWVPMPSYRTLSDKHFPEGKVATAIIYADDIITTKNCEEESGNVFCNSFG